MVYANRGAEKRQSRFSKYRLNRSRLSNTERCGRVGRRSSREYYIFNKLINLNNYKLIYYRDYCK